MDYSDKRLLSKNEQFVILYHDIFSYPLKKSELNRWQSSYSVKNSFQIINVKGFHLLKGREDIVKKRLKRKKFSNKKLIVAKRAAKVLELIPSVKFIGITGSLSMNNASQESDIDFLIITSCGWLWSTRILSYFLLKLSGFSVRRAGDSDEKDKLCLNMWLDESDLYFNKQNVFTSHEIAQIVPLINKNKTYEVLLFTNSWIFNFWPKACIKPKVYLREIKKTNQNVLEFIAFNLQKIYMKSKKSREVVSETRAFFHPFDWGKKVIHELESRGNV